MQQLAAVCRINPLGCLRCCALAVYGYEEGGREATKISTPVRPAPGFSRVAASQVGTIGGEAQCNSSLLCVASTPWGVCVVAR